MSHHNIPIHMVFCDKLKYGLQTHNITLYPWLQEASPADPNQDCPWTSLGVFRPQRPGPLVSDYTTCHCILDKRWLLRNLAEKLKSLLHLKKEKKHAWVERFHLTHKRLPLRTLFVLCMWSGVTDVITHAKFHLNRFSSFGSPGGRKSPFPIGLENGSYNSVTH